MKPVARAHVLAPLLVTLTIFQGYRTPDDEPGGL